MNNALLYFGGLLAAVFAALFAVPAFIDWNGYRGVFEEEASKVLGRDVRVNGGVNLRLLPTPYVRFEKVRLADVSGQTGEPFVRAESFTMWLSVSPLLRGVLEANRIELDTPVLTLALDGQGSGNWASIELRPGSLPFVPRDVTLQSVKVINGALALFNAKAEPVMRVAAINGELSADALAGPYRFKGQADWGGETRDVRFATSDMAADGAFRVKAAMLAKSSQRSFAIDGGVAKDSSGAMKLSGALTGMLPLAQSATGGPATKTEASPVLSDPKAPLLAADPNAPPGFSIKGDLTADAYGLSLKDLAMTLDGIAEPQIISGSASAAWSDVPRVDLVLNSKWLDLDRLAGAAEKPASLSQIKQFVAGLLSSVAGDGAASARIDIDQIKVGGETAGALSLDAERRDATTRISKLQAGLPGGSRMTLSGDLKDQEGQSAFSGQIFLHGSSLARLKTWVEKSGAEIDIEADGKFSIAGRIDVGQSRFDLTDASADVGGRSMTGELHVINGERQRVDITVQSPRIDSSEVFPQTAHKIESALRSIIAGGTAAETPLASSGESAEASGAMSDVRVRLLAGELKHGAAVYRDVDARIEVAAGDIRLPKVRFKTPAGLSVEIEGTIKTAGALSSGALAFDLVGDSAKAAGDAVETFGLQSIISTERAEALGKLRLAGSTKFGSLGPGSVTVATDGTIGRAEVAVAAELVSGLTQWRTAPVRIQATAKGGDVADILALSGSSARSAGPGQERPARAAVTVTGVFANSAGVVGEVTSEGLRVGYDGDVSFSDDARLATRGVASIAATDVRDVIGLIGGARPLGLTNTPLEGRVDVALDAGKWTLAADGLGLGGTTVSGAATVARGGTSRLAVDADLTANRVFVAGLLSALVDKPLETGALAVRPAEDGAQDDPLPRSVWPEGNFNLGLIAPIDGTLRMKFDKLIVTDAVSTGAGSATIALSEGGVALRDLNAKAIGGDVTGSLDLTKDNASLLLDAKLRLTNGDLAVFGPRASGRATFDVTAKGSARSPAGMMAVLAGTGQAELENAKVAGPGIVAVRAMAEDVLAGKTPNELKSVSDAALAALGSSSADVGSRKIAVTVGDGAISFDDIELAGAEGRTSIRTNYDLLDLSVESLWQVAAAPPAPALPSDQIPSGWSPASKSTLMAPLTVTYRGKLTETAEVQPELDVAAFQRDLILLQTERQTEELTRLRLLDEQRAVADKARRKAIEEERAAARAARSNADPEDQKLPPVIPQSALPPAEAAPGTSGSVTPDQSGLPAAAAEPSTAATVGTINGAEAATQIEGSPEGDAGAIPVPRPATRPRPRPRQAEPRSSPGEEIRRSFGGY